MRACFTGQAPWKQQQRSSAFKWIKTPAQSPEPAGIGQTGCSLDEDLRLIISHAAFVFAATVALMGRTGPWRRRGRKPAVASGSATNLGGAAAVGDPWALSEDLQGFCFVCHYAARPIDAALPETLCCLRRCYGLRRIQRVTLARLLIRQHQINRVNIS